MERRDFFRAGLAASFASLGGPASALALDPVAARRLGPLRLNFNENALGLSMAARRAVIDGIMEGNRYPHSATTPLLAALALKHDVPPESIVFGNGSTEILRIAVSALGGADATIVLADPTFEDVPGYSTPFGPRLERIPLAGDFAHDIPAMRTRAEAADGPVLVYICNPNNPTATLTDCDSIDEWIAHAQDNVYFLIDEAYFEYVNSSHYRTSVKWVADKRNVLVVRTFSKIYAMAGMRVGYGMAHPETAAKLRAYVTRNTPNHLAGAAALASLQDEHMVPRSLENNRRCMEIVLGTFDELGIEYIPSQANFMMHRVSGDLATYIERMLEHGVRVGRQFPPMLGYNRLSMGLPEEMETFVDVLRTFRERGWA